MKGALIKAVFFNVLPPPKLIKKSIYYNIIATILCQWYRRCFIISRGADQWAAVLSLQQI